MNIIVQVNIYRRKNDDVEFLLLKRTEDEGGFWQPVTSKVRPGKTVADTLKRAITEETGIKKFLHLSDELYTYEWYERGERGRDVMVAAEVEGDGTIILDHRKHQKYEWVSFSEAAKLVKWHGNKEYLDRLHRHILQEEISPPSEQSQPKPTANTASGRMPYNEPPQIHDVHINPL